MTPTTIQVITSKNKPIRFQWKRIWHSVTAIEDDWVDTGEWWNGEGEKTFYRVICGEKLFEIYFDAKDQAWYLYKAYD